MEKKFYKSEDVEFLFLEKKGEGIKPYQIKSDIEKVLSSLRYEIFQKEIDKKIELFTEDEEARIFLRGIIRPDLRKNVKIYSVDLGSSNYIHLIQNKVPSFLSSLIVLDGDCKKTKFKNIVMLPGGKRPENVFYDLLNSFPAEDDFWEAYGGYSKEYFLANRPKSDNRKDMKEWFNSHKKHWGYRCNKIIKIWKSKNKNLVDVFNEEIEIIINRLYKN